MPLDLPTPGADAGTWGTKLNNVLNGTGAGTLDETLKATYVQASLPANTLVTLGDSVTAHADNADSSSAFKSGRGVWTWTLMELGQRLQWLANAGISGNTTAQMLARFDTDVAVHSPGWVAVLAGTNDVTNSVPAATTRANITAMLNKIRSIGARCLLGTVPPRDTDTAQQGGDRAAHNAWLRTLPRTRPDVVLVDFAAALTDPADGTYVNAYTHDGVHLTASGAQAASRLLTAALDPVVPRLDRLPASPLDATNLLTNPFMTGGTTVATGWTVADSGGSVTTRSKVARTDGLPGEWQQITCTTVGGGNRLYQRVAVPAVIPVGAKVVAVAEFQSDNDWSATERLRLNVLGLRADFTTSYGSRYLMLDGGDVWPANVRPASGVLTTEGKPLTVPADAANVEVAVERKGLGTIRVGRVGLYVAT